MNKLSKGHRGHFHLMVGLAALIVILGVLMSVAWALNSGEHSRIILSLEQAKIANHDLNENVLRLKTFMLQTYDPLVSDTYQLKLICKAWLTDPRYLALREGRLLDSTQAFCHAVEQKSELVERYKSQHSILQNSIKYLPVLISQMKTSKYASEAQSALAEILLFNLDPDLSPEKNLRERLARLNATAQKGQNDDLMSSVLLHIGSIIDHSQIRHDLENQILAHEFTGLFKKVEQDYFEAFQTSQRRAIIYNYFLILFCVFLVGWLVVVFRRLKEAGESLHDLNENLEQKVLLRTEELSQTMRKLADNQQLLTQSAKMTALGEMAGGIAHEINTPLAAILMNANVMLESLEHFDPQIYGKRLEAIVKIVGRVSKIISGLRRFSRNTDSSTKTITPVQIIIDDTLSLCSEKLKSHSVELQIELVDPQIAINCIPEQISQVLLNFLNNSFDALCESVAVGERWIRISAAEKAGRVEISVTDAGRGLPPEVRQKLMQPFFTTKPPGVGTGLGLSISKGIIEQHGGQLLFDDSSANTRFIMNLPMTANRPSMAS